MIDEDTKRYEFIAVSRYRRYGEDTKRYGFANVQWVTHLISEPFINMIILHV